MRVFSPRWVFCCVLGLSGSAAAFDQPYRVIDGGAFDLSRGPAEYSLDPAGSDDVPGDSDLDALRAAFRSWSCVEGTALRFVEKGDGVHSADLSDGVNTLFWDETNEYGLGAGTLGVTLGDAGQGTRAQADIIFNGFDHEWSTDDRGSATDVGSIALHEIGHFLGLDHPCEHGANDEELVETCNGADQSVMTPVWDGNVERSPLPDDEEGVRALYPASDDEARCDGPFLKGERCSCDGECVTGLACVPGTDGDAVCAELCTSKDGDCGPGFACVLDAPEGDEDAPGACVKTDDGEKPAGSICVARGECASGECALVAAVGRSVCRTDCDGDGDCDAGGRCVDGACLIGARGKECPADKKPEGCGCQTTHSAPASTVVALGAAVLWCGLRSRRRHGRH